MLGMDPEDFRNLVKKTLQACDGSVTAAALSLGVDRTSLSRALNHRGLVEWYVPYRNRITLERLRARRRRAYERQRRRALAAQGLDPDVFFKPRKGR
jgi:hypothetical protein